MLTPLNVAYTRLKFQQENHSFHFSSINSERHPEMCTRDSIVLAFVTRIALEDVTLAYNVFRRDLISTHLTMVRTLLNRHFQYKQAEVVKPADEAAFAFYAFVTGSNTYPPQH